jgi:hypothetical protein
LASSRTVNSVPLEHRGGEAARAGGIDQRAARNFQFAERLAFHEVDHGHRGSRREIEHQRHALIVGEGEQPSMAVISARLPPGNTISPTGFQRLRVVDRDEIGARAAHAARPHRIGHVDFRPLVGTSSVAESCACN